MATAGVLDLDFALGPHLTTDEARTIYELGEEAVVFAILELARRLKRAEGQCASASSPSRPSGMTPVHQKPAAKKRGKKPGRKAGHPGSRRRAPDRIDQRKSHRVAC